MLAPRGCDLGRRGGQVQKVGERWGEGEDSQGSQGWKGTTLTEAVLALALPAVVRKLNELYKASVVSCQGLSLRLRRFFLDKQRLLDRIQSVTAEKLIFSHAVQTVGRMVDGRATACWARGRGPPAGAHPWAPQAQPVPGAYLGFGSE